MNKRVTLAVLRLLFGLLDLIAIIVQVIYLVHHHALNLVNFFSYFTILSNVLATFVLIVGGLYLLCKRKPSRTSDLIRSAAVVYMAVTGIVYAALLSGENLGLLLPWVNFILHMLMPVVVVADWLYQPSKTKMKMKRSLSLLIFPLAFVAYSLIRGPIVKWYPYLFLNPSKAGGYAGVALYCVGILVLFLIIIWLLKYSGSKLKRHVT